MLHLTNGDSAASGIRESGLSAEVLSWIDVLHEGPVPPDLDLDQLRIVRAEFIASCGWGTFEEAVEQFSQRDRALAQSLGQDEVVLWFEHDLYDQLQLVQILDWFAQQEVVRTKLTLICDAEYLGSSTVERLRVRYPERQPVSPKQLALARAAWAAFRSPDPTHLTDLLRKILRHCRSLHRRSCGTCSSFLRRRTGMWSGRALLPSQFLLSTAAVNIPGICPCAEHECSSGSLSGFIGYHFPDSIVSQR
jgi:hypothetical protein